MTVRRSIGLVGACLVLALVFVGIDLILGPSLATSVASLTCFIVLAVLLYRFEPVFFILVFLFVLGQFGALLSGVLIESGVYVSEQRRFGFVTGSTVSLAFYTMFFLAAAFYLFQLVDAPRRLSEFARRHRVWAGARVAIYALVVGVLVLVFIGLLVNGSPLLEQRDRFSYWRTNSIPFLQPIHNQLSTLVFAVGLAFPFARRRPERYFALLLVLTALGYFVLQGEKFTALVQVLYSFAMPWLVRMFSSRSQKPSVKRALIIGIAIGSALGGLILYQYYTTFQASNPLANLSQRIALQGHVWWGAYDNYTAGTLPVAPSDQLRREADALLTLGNPTPGVDTGMSYLMHVVAPTDLVERYRGQGIRFTMGYPAIGLVTVGPWGLLLFQVLAAGLAVLVAMLILRGVRTANVLIAIVGYKLLYELNGVIGMGNLSEMLSGKTVLYVGLAALLIAAALSKKSLAAAAVAVQVRTRKHRVG